MDFAKFIDRQKQASAKLKELASFLEQQETVDVINKTASVSHLEDLSALDAQQQANADVYFRVKYASHLSAINGSDLQQQSPSLQQFSDSLNYVGNIS